MVSEQPPPAPEQPWSPPSRTFGHATDGARSRTVLVVDDDAAWLASLERWLAADGYRVIGISRGEWAVQAVEHYDPEVVVLDVHLPGADGLDILRQLRSRRPKISIIIMTAFGGFDVRERARRLGAAAYFDKPFRVSDLITAVGRVGWSD
jgi:DNA-binding NtrC family response regulator